MEARTPVLKLNKCRKAYDDTVFKVDDRSICAGSQGVDSCTVSKNLSWSYIKCWVISFKFSYFAYLSYLIKGFSTG